jgi:uncharacterized protein (TIGR00369 family)
MNQTELLDLLVRVPLGPVGDALGGRVIEYDAGARTATLEFTPGAAHTNLFGTVHGGMQTAMLDLCTALAAIGASGLTQTFPTIEMGQRFLRPAPTGRLLARGRALQLGRNVAFMEGTLLSPGGEVLATGTVTARSVARDWIKELG